MNTYMKHLLITLILTLTMTSQSWSQDTWVKTFGGSGDDRGFSITATLDGGVFITGHTESNDGDFKGMNKGKYDIFIMKIDRDGSVLWNKTFGGSVGEREQEFGESMIALSDGSVVVTGSFYSNDGDFKGMNKGRSDMFIIKLDGDGNILWRSVFGGVGTDEGKSITTTLDNDLVVTGYTNSSDGDFKDTLRSGRLFVLRCDNRGTTQWMRSYDGCRIGRSITTTSDDGILVTGTSGNDGHGNTDVFILKLMGNGEVVWKKTLGGSELDWGNSIVTTSDGGILITGQTLSNDGDFQGMNKGRTDIFVIKLDKNGDVLWKKVIGELEGDEGLSVSPTSNGGAIITGYTEIKNGDFEGMSKGGGTDIFVIKLDKDGDILWKRTFGGSNTELGCSITTAINGGILLTGYTGWNEDGDFEGMSKGGMDIFVMKLDSNGNLNPSTSVTDYTSITPSLLVTPNPITTSSTVMFTIGTPTSVRIELLNTLGESVSVLHDGFMESGEHRVPLGVSSVSSGVYYVRMTSEGTVNSTQVVVLK